MSVNASVLSFAGVGLLNVYALLLVVLRAPLFGVRLYRPMLLNIGLSVAPALALAATLALLVLVVTAVPVTWVLWLVLGVGVVVWLLLLPNSAYLITELNLSHRATDDPVPLWYDIVLVLTLALSGVANTTLNLALAQVIFALVSYPNDAHPFQRASSWILAGVVIVLVTLGMYLGRYVRFNSWDVAHPRAFARKVREHFRVGARAREAAAFCLAHALLLAIVYLLVVGSVVQLL